ncbi:MAG: hypothetical protein DMD53_01725 [Gemmatimonadetes bacterium]|nr:MAG: hypothetical protein DMD53_01725 [Gemmatimonadota bacterium]
MKRIALLALTASLLVGCEKPTGPTTHGSPAFDLSSTRTTFSGEATVVSVTVPSLPPPLSPIILGHAGPLDASGGADRSSLVSVTISKEQTAGLLALDAEVVHAATVAQGNHSRAEASVADANLSVPGYTIHADALSSRAEAKCDGAGGASASGSSEIAGLIVNGTPITVTGQPNQMVSPPPVKIVINEQSGSTSGNPSDITVNALHVTVTDLSGGTLADVVISSSHADITCAGCSSPLGDFVTGGGWINGPSGARANFAVAGGMKNGALWGHLTYIDHGSRGPKVKGTGVTAYTAPDPVNQPTLRHIEGTADIDGASGTYMVDVADNGEPGRDDTFSLKLSSGYTASGKLAGGNIQLHGESPCP